VIVGPIPQRYPELRRPWCGVVEALSQMNQLGMIPG
jgi:hypothetical protein